MKIFASVAAFAAMIALAPAYTISWGTGAGLPGRIQFGGDYIAASGDTANLANAAVYLVYLGENDTFDFAETGETSDEIVQTGTVAAAGLVGRGYSSYSKDLGTAFDDASTMTAGVSTFGVMIT